MKEGEVAIRSAIGELEEYRYLKRIRYRCKKSKIWKGSFWVYSDQPGQWNLSSQKDLLDHQGLEMYLPDEPDMGNPDVDMSNVENQGLIILKDKKTKDNNSNLSPGQKTPESSNTSIKEKNKPYLSTVKRLARAIQKKKNIKLTSQQISSWANEIRMLCEQNEIPLPRINKAVKWYYNHIGGQYIPVIESGRSLRDKFLRLENAMHQENGNMGGKNDHDEDEYEPEKWWLNEPVE